LDVRVQINSLVQPDFTSKFSYATHGLVQGQMALSEIMWVVLLIQQAQVGV